MKKQKQQKSTNSGSAHLPSSRIFSPFRTVGLVSTNVPCSVSTLGDTYIVSSVVGNAVQQYDAANLHLLYMTQPQTSEPIECITTKFHDLFVAAGNDLIVYRRGRSVASTELNSQYSTDFRECKGSRKSKAISIEVFGGFVCVCYPRGVQVFKWSSKSAELVFYTSISLPSVLGSLTGMCHPPTYLNKLLIATKSCLVLVNVKTGKVIHTFNEPGYVLSGVEACPVALDIAACYGITGEISIFDLKTDSILFTLQTSEPITSISFRSDTGVDSAPLLGVGTSSGSIYFYDLQLRRRVQSFRSFSSATIGKIAFLPGQAVCVVSSGNNTLSELVFDPPLATRAVGAHRARLLRHRGGHSTPPSTLEFADAESHFLLSGSDSDSLWALSLRKDSQSRSFGKLNDKDNFGSIIAMAYSEEKSSRWETLVTAHAQSNIARCWSVSNCALAAKKTLTSVDGGIVKSVFVSSCGNFALLGSALGGVSMFNLQSGVKKAFVSASKSSIQGLALTPNNALLVTASLDGIIRFFDMTSATVISEPVKICELDLQSGSLTNLRYNSSSGLVAVSTDSSALFVIDTNTFKIVREFYGHTGAITDFDFFPNGRMLISASLDSTLRTFDIPTGQCVDAVRVKAPVVKLRISWNSEWLATAHVSGLGIQLWAIKSVYELQAVEDVVDIEMPVVSGENGVSLIDQIIETNEKTAETVGVDEERNDGLIQLSNQPKVKFTTLTNLDEIRARNKPIAAPEKPQRAPFFLTAGSNNDAMEEDTTESIEEVTHVDNINTTPVSQFSEKLRSGDLVEYLVSLPPAATDLEIRSLDLPQPDGEILAFVRLMIEALKSGRNFELVQAWISILFKSHMAELASEEFIDILAELEEAQTEAVSRVQEQQRFCAGIIQFVRY